MAALRLPRFRTKRHPVWHRLPKHPRSSRLRRRQPPQAIPEQALLRRHARRWPPRVTQNRSRLLRLQAVLLRPCHHRVRRLLRDHLRLLPGPSPRQQPEQPDLQHRQAQQRQKLHQRILWRRPRATSLYYGLISVPRVPVQSVPVLPTTTGKSSDGLCSPGQKHGGLHVGCRAFGMCFIG